MSGSPSPQSLHPAEDLALLGDPSGLLAQRIGGISVRRLRCWSRLQRFLRLFGQGFSAGTQRLFLRSFCLYCLLRLIG
jgi:hypothetical protein